MLKMVWYDFWPADMVGKNIESELKQNTTQVVFCYLSVYVPAFMYHFGNFTIALIRNKLGFEAAFPFNSEISPIYEILYVSQVWLNIYASVTSILGHDFLLLGLTGNVVAQVTLLEEALKQLGTGNEIELNEKIRVITKKMYYTNDSNESEEIKLMISCFNHHRMLLR